MSPAKLQNATTKHPQHNHEIVAEGKSLKIVSEFSEKIVKKIGRERINKESRCASSQHRQQKCRPHYLSKHYEVRDPIRRTLRW